MSILLSIVLFQIISILPPQRVFNLNPPVSLEIPI